MPRVADHDARHGQITDAVQRLIVRHGLTSVTVARTAAEAGMSVGLVQHYFTAKDEMLLATFTRVNGRFTARVDELVNRGEAEGRTIAEMLRQALTELVPLDDARRAEFLVRLAFADQAAHNARLAGVQRETLVGIRSRVAQAIKNGTVCGEVAQGTDAADQALRIVAFAEGLALHTHIDPDGTPKPAILAALDDHLGRVFTGTCRRAQLG
ncbi:MULTISPECIES: TetR/AcrR family transcriptional regulator [Streptomyces]|uniref:TetR/AcrR family transcriptional regulator n=3 Tax=Streptomyces TaxID=1883 RepID=A0ABD5JBZ4_9ACTN|nr:MULTISPECIES: TetR/AcrR family transcriptional regulator [Streptomyces]MEE4585751.1 TetR/AcrR family transcriptional regulator [Streptomyces sp. DSM 41602]KUL62591.1 transcriptional regulator [Streptomyces violaceusniger]QTI87619.1 TetR/AcrR family transcriptional regulator [Streptomyces sp. AgN23]RSS47530.1 TetR family transcriptional regulator [Streptomyces sp. WAC05858]WJE01209.1 TetR/AcrR family transcriptional regulator [Streptomyces antimycoticus]